LAFRKVTTFFSGDFIEKFGAEIQQRKNSSDQLIAWLVSNCGTHSERENFVEQGSIR
jgi:hypothetical protein